MQKLKLTSIIALVLITTYGSAQSKEEKAIQSVIISFAKAGDNNAADELDSYLDENYRVIMNRLFGNNEIAVMSKSVYIEKIKSKEFGGDTRKLTFENILVSGSTATAKVIIEGKKMKMASLITLVKDENQNWKLISDIPTIL